MGRHGHPRAPSSGLGCGHGPNPTHLAVVHELAFEAITDVIIVARTRVLVRRVARNAVAIFVALVAGAMVGVAHEVGFALAALAAAVRSREEPAALALARVARTEVVTRADAVVAANRVLTGLERAASGERGDD